MDGLSLGYSLLIILIIAVLTFGARLFPFLVFGRNRKVPEVAGYIGSVLPPAVMILLLVFSIRYISLMSHPHGMGELISIVVVMLLYRFTKNSLAAMVGGTAVYMVLIRLEWFATAISSS